MLTRREFLSGSLSAGVASSLGSPVFFSTEALELVTHTYHLRKEKARGLSLKIGFLTDLHMGPALPASLLLEAIAHLNAAQVDLVILGGDLIWVPDSRLSRLFRVVRNEEFKSYDLTSRQQQDLLRYTAELLSGLRAPYGVFSVLGNHDRYLYPRSAVEELLGKNIELLVNQSRIISVGNSKVELFGTDDYWTGRPSSAPPTEYPRVCVSHNPDFIEVSLRERGEWFDVALCGHTHGGQIQLPVLGALTYNVKSPRFHSGPVYLENSMVYTSRGLGVVEIPYRVACRPEVTILEIKGSEGK